MNALDDRIKALTLERFKDHRFQSEVWYQFLEQNLDDAALHDDRSSIIRDRARRVARTWKDDQGRRFLENLPVLNDDGEITHEWAQPRLFDYDEAVEVVSQTAKIGERICRKANALARRFNSEKGYDIPLPFPHLTDGGPILLPPIPTQPGDSPRA